MYWGSSIVKHLRARLEEALSRTGAPNGSGKPSWQPATEGVVAAEAQVAHVPERVWEVPRRPPIVIGGGPGLAASPYRTTP
jgi:hypothetical protein